MSAIHAKDKDLHVLVDNYIAKPIAGSFDVAIETANLLVKVTSLTRWTCLEQLIQTISSIGKRLIDAQPREFTCGNVVRRVLAIIREELEDDEKLKNNNNNSNNDNDELLEVDNKNGLTQNSNSSMFNLLTPNKPNQIKKPTNHVNKRMGDQRMEIIQSIRDLIDEIKNVDQEIEGMLDDLVHDNEVLLTPTPNSITVLRFLKKARQKRNFKVFVTENFPNHTSVAHDFAKELAEANVQTTIIPDSSVFAIMSSVSKVIVGARCVFANGGFITAAGVSTVVECAKEHRTPVFAVTGLYKFSPCYPYDRESLIEFGNSGKVIKYQENSLVKNAQTANPLFDYVPPENIDIFITNVGGISPNFIYRIVLDNYRQEDIDL